MTGAVELARNGFLLGVIFVIGRVVYNLFLHPLRKYPGPLLYRLTSFPRALNHTMGCLHVRVTDFHKKYGPVVRIGPNELAFSSAQAWRDIYGHKKAGEEEFPKFAGVYKMFKSQPNSIINSDRAEHGLLRRQLSHGFSDRSMRDQEPIIGTYVDLLISRLNEAVKKDSSQNMREWLNWTTFDIIGDLSLGADRAFGCLAKGDYHPWVRIVTETVRQNGLFLGLSQLGFGSLISWANQYNLVSENEHLAIVSEKVGQRMEEGVDRPDFLQGLIRNKSQLNLDHDHMTMNASLLVIAGSETTATLLSGALFLLTTHPEVLKQLEQEVRSAYKHNEDITLTSVGNLSYMLACLNETLRRYPPVVTGLPRQAPKGGAMVDGNFVTEDTVVSIFQYAVNHDENYWREPWSFSPERWMNDPKYKGDQLDAMQSFSVGPRNCIGRNLAYAEMRLILAKLVFNFDMSLADDSRGWLTHQKAYTVWDKPPLNIHLKPVSI